MKNVDLSEFTKIAVKNEKERKQRVKIREKMVCNYIEMICFSHVIETYFVLFYLLTIFCGLVSRFILGS